MPEYFDPNATGEAVALQRGIRRGEARGFDAGQESGYAAGVEDGRAEGWNSAVAECNQSLLKQMEFTRQHVADKELLADRLREQGELLTRLQERLEQMELENSGLRQANADLREVVTSLKIANEQMQTEVEEMDKKLRLQTEAYNQTVWDYNRNHVFATTVRSVLERLTSTPTQEARNIRQMFTEEYTRRVSAAVADKLIQGPLEADVAFAKSMPRTQRFIAEMLRSVAEKRLAPEAEETHEHSVDHGI
jgi:flagellar biosynthesis/type III secretory pathway protein FliH